MPCAIINDRGVVQLEGVRGFSPGEYADSIHGAEARILQSLDEPMTYDDLVGYSGFAFRANIHNAMCPSGGHPCRGYPCVDNAIRARPRRARPFLAFPWEPPKPDPLAWQAEARAAIVASIDRGIPVHYGSEEDGLIIGYAEEGRRWHCVHPYHKWGAETFWHDEVGGFAGGKWPWAITVWLEPKPPHERADPCELARIALKQAVDMWRTDARGDYFCGDAAYDRWIEWLRGVDAGDVDNPKAGMQGNGWCLDVLNHCRPIASRWLEKHAGLFDQHAGDRLRRAAAHYARIAPLLIEGYGCPWTLAPGPDKFDDWTPEMRKTQIARLEAARELEARAIAEIEAALATMQ